MRYFLYLLTVFFVLNTSCKNCENKVVSYSIEEPYTDTEKVEVELTSRVVPNTMKYERKKGAIIIGDNPVLVFMATIENTSDYNGDFEFSATLTSQGGIVEFNKSIFIAANSTETISIEKEINPFTFETNIELQDYSIKNPTITTEKEVTKYKSEIRYKNCNTCENNCD